MTDQLEEGYRSDLASVANVSDLDDHHVVVDYPTSDDVVDSYRTSWSPGVFDDSLRSHLPPLCFNHDPNVVIGRATKWENLGNRTRIVSRFASFDNVPKAREAHSLISDGIMNSFSFHFRGGVTKPHSTQRGARTFVKARLMETSPVTFGSIPGAVAVGIRSEEAVLETPSLDEIWAMQDRGVLSVDGVRAMIAEHYPLYREHISLPQAGDPVPAAADAGTDGGAGTVDLDGTRDDEDAGILARAVDAALDEATNLIDTVGDRTTLPEPIQQAIDLVHAASVAADELLEVMGVGDPDDGSATGGRAQLDAAAEKKLDDSDYAYIDSKGGRHLPIPDAAHVRNALARFDQTHFDSDADKAKARAKIEAAAKRFGVDMSGGDRSGRPSSGETTNLEGVLSRLEKY